MRLKYVDLLSVSVVSHGQLAMVADLLSDLEEHCLSTSIEVLLTLNIEEVNELDVGRYSYPIKIINNDQPMGFGANHNQAFMDASGSYFCVLNPDIRLVTDPFPALISVLQDPKVGVCAPLVVNNEGDLEDSARQFPSPWTVLKRFISGKRASDYVIAKELVLPDWVGGMFMLFRSKTYREINGFDERYFLYYEDVDICARLTNARYVVVLCTASKVIHLAQRTSHKSFKYLRWHITSMLRFFMTPSFWRLL
jgi:N-acetylglucosaminyl-diphospho-decaprenol L-rhamnosyltransferase